MEIGYQKRAVRETVSAFFLYPIRMTVKLEMHHVRKGMPIPCNSHLKGENISHFSGKSINFVGKD